MIEHKRYTGWIKEITCPPYTVDIAKLTRKNYDKYDYILLPTYFPEK